MRIKSLKVMLPYMGDEYTVGEIFHPHNQSSSRSHDQRIVDHGEVRYIDSIVDNRTGRRVYLISFIGQDYIELVDVPVQVIWEEE